MGDKKIYICLESMPEDNQKKAFRSSGQRVFISPPSAFFISRPNHASVIMKQGRESEATEVVFCLQAKKLLHSGSYEHACVGCQKQKIKTFFCTMSV